MPLPNLMAKVPRARSSALPYCLRGRQDLLKAPSSIAFSPRHAVSSTGFLVARQRREEIAKTWAAGDAGHAARALVDARPCLSTSTATCLAAVAPVRRSDAVVLRVKGADARGSVEKRVHGRRAVREKARAERESRRRRRRNSMQRWRITSAVEVQPAMGTRVARSRRMAMEGMRRTTILTWWSEEGRPWVEKTSRYAACAAKRQHEMRASEAFVGYGRVHKSILGHRENLAGCAMQKNVEQFSRQTPWSTPIISSA